ncbi:ABC transporter ATP-binding protein [Halobacterium sp. KA-6]|uniref:ABC transporter ATP-binding protein n=1 Tax=Halobacterium sp. KA-6 TaxID=2896368 RepID=UPI001E2FB14C|nr:ABC transporter ATP-binding protein [Halobacterium sp. KA-6]MCD2204585.1 ABC transporter ATP-binding protein [Halobacterium sp. KA-6]
MSDEPLLAVDGIEKHFGGITAVDGVEFEIEEGTIVGLIGPNGAGKTTTFKMLSGFLPPDAGEIRYRGTDLQDIMQPSTSDKTYLGGSAALIAGLGGLGLAAQSDPSIAIEAGATAIGAGVGLGAYHGQELLKTRYFGHKYSRPFQVSRAGMMRTFQITRGLEGLTVFENLLLSPKDQPGENVIKSWLHFDSVEETEAENRERAEEVLELLDLEHLRDEYASNLSGGQRKLLELGRVLMADPELILLDEPVAGVNPTLSKTLLARIKELRDQGYTFCVVEHDMDVIMDLSERIIVMHQGKKLMEGTPEEVQGDQQVIDAYLGG